MALPILLQNTISLPAAFFSLTPYLTRKLGFAASTEVRLRPALALALPLRQQGGRRSENVEATTEQGDAAWPAGLGARKGIGLPTCFCSSLSPLIASSTGKREWARCDTTLASGASGVRSLQFATRRPRSQAAVAISPLHWKLRQSARGRGAEPAPQAPPIPGFAAPAQSARGGSPAAYHPLLLAGTPSWPWPQHEPISGDLPPNYAVVGLVVGAPEPL